MKTITFYSYKGGVGRTLALANVAKYLARFGQSVVVMDFDLEAPGLHYKFGLHQQDESAPPLQGVVDILHTFVTQGKLPDSLEDYVYDVGKTHGKGRIRLLPAGNVPSIGYWKKLASIDWHALFYTEPDPPGIPLFEELRLWIEQTFKPDFLLIDSRTGITEIGGVATTVMPDMVVCLLINNLENLEGAREVLHSIQKAPRLEGRKNVEILPVVTRIPKYEDPSIENKILKEVRNKLNQDAPDLTDTLALEKMYILHSEPSLQIQEVLTMDVDLTSKDSPLLDDYLYLFSRLIPRETIQPYIAELVEEAKAAFWDDQDEAQKKLEALVFLSGDPLAYRTLVTLYDTRNSKSNTALKASFNFYSIAKDPADIVLQKTIQKHFESFDGWAKLSLFINFVIDVWRASQDKDINLAKKITISLFNIRRNEEGIQFFLEMFNMSGGDIDVFVLVLEALINSKNFESAFDLIKKHETILNDQEKFQVIWVKFALATEDPTHINHIISTKNFIIPKLQEHNQGFVVKFQEKFEFFLYDPFDADIPF